MPDAIVESGLRRCAWSDMIVRLYRKSRLRKYCLKAAGKFEGGPMFSSAWRRILADYHGLNIGAYSYGCCMTPGIFPPGVTIGRYVSIANGVEVFRRNHPIERISTHPFFYNKEMGYVAEDSIELFPLTIGHDAWIGSHAIILPGCKSIGIGAVVGAGAVVTKDVPDFAIVGGNPAKLIRHRFSEEQQCRALESKWWEKTIEENLKLMDAFQVPIEDLTNHPLLGKEQGSDV